MNKSAGILATACSVCLFGIVQAAPSAPLKDFSSDAARITRATDEAALTAPSNKAPRDVVMEYLRGRGYSEKTLASLELVRSHTVDWTGVTHLWFAQRVQGMRVYGTYVRASVNLEGELVELVYAEYPEFTEHSKISHQVAERRARHDLRLEVLLGREVERVEREPAVEPGQAVGVAIDAALPCHLG